MKFLALFFLLPALLAAGIPPGTEGPALSRDLGDLRGADLRDRDLAGQEETLFAADFDTRTRWPEDLLYFIADDMTRVPGGPRDLTWYARDVDRFVSLNETLPEALRRPQ